LTLASSAILAKREMSNTAKLEILTLTILSRNTAMLVETKRHKTLEDIPDL
jgi:hypothetical protein